MLSPCGLGHSGGKSCRALPASLPTHLGSAGTCLAGVCVSIHAQEYVCGPYIIPWLWRATGLFPGRAWPPGRTGAHQGPASLPQPKPNFEQSKKEAQRLAAPGPPAEGIPQSRQEQELEKQAALNKGTTLPSAGPTPTGSQYLAGTLPLVPRPAFSWVFRFALQWASSPPGPSRRQRRRWCPRPACPGGALVAWPTGSALG